MEIIVDNISKKFSSRWIFKQLNFHFLPGVHYAITGPNGAGKSTLLNIIISKTPVTKGLIRYQSNGKKISADNVYKEFSIATTSMSLIEEFTLEELIKFHFRFREPVQNLNINEIFQLLELPNEGKKFVANFSSGMKQRLKIGLALFSKSSVLIFDEPGANLDERSKTWFHNMLTKFADNRMVIIASNESRDYQTCTEYLDISTFKT